MFSSAACCVMINRCCCCCITLRRNLVEVVAKLAAIGPSFEEGKRSSNSWACFVSRMRDQRIAYLVIFTVEEALRSLLKLLVLLYSITTA